MSGIRAWTLEAALAPILSTFLAFTYAIYILAYPPKHKKTSILLLALPVTYAFIHHLDVAPNRNVSDTFGRFLCIWYAHMSYEVVILEFKPPTTKENDGWKTRVKEAYKVLFDRNHAQVTCSQEEHVKPDTRPGAKKQSHGFSRNRFLRYHLTKATLLSLALWVWESYFADLSFPTTDNSIPFSLRIHTTFDWLFISLILYDLTHSLFALLFTCLLRFDPPSTWSLSLFGPLTAATSVRNYWSNHWHNYIYHSFSAHAKVLTRGWLGMQRGKWTTRVVENTLVFAASGGMHSAVRWVQEGYGEGGVWFIAVFYVSQMGAILVEDVVLRVWRCLKQKAGIREGESDWWWWWVNGVERAVGYVWVFGWFMWSVPLYVHTRDAWADKVVMRKFAARWEEHLMGEARNRED
ncbi:hypothetical protein N0V83_008050 [Neocucurbitaria cava]|uniref:Wax synthase domain-containing protein n=1 Tax=Neocucurbitaria cava TaxID=798079 RepID=A0A9W8Y363_9PLEO|nr:hypothetical protein N0V83_008050 [Neocucurbitaria cava]